MKHLRLRRNIHFSMVWIIVVTIILVAAFSLFFKMSDNGKVITYLSLDNTPVTQEVCSYGFFNQEDKVEGVKYKVDTGVVVLSVIFSETIVVPAILLGLYLYEPIGPDIDNIAELRNPYIKEE